MNANDQNGKTGGTVTQAEPAVVEDDQAKPKRRRAAQSAPLVWATRLAFVVVIIGCWEVLAERGTIDPSFSGQPSKIWSSFIELFTSSSILTDLKTTMYETLVGFAIAVAIGVVGAYWMVRVPFLERTFYPLATAANAIPRLALMPVFIIWFGLGPASKIVNIVAFVSFLALINALGAFMQADRDLLLLAQVLGFSERERMRKFVLPSAVPVLFGMMELALIYSFGGAIIGEMLGGYNGLGVKIQTDANTLDTNGFFAVVLLVVILTLLLVQILVYFRKRLFRWSVIEMRTTQVM